ncbi:MltR family transcriptional regulator [Bacillus mobilis]|uniref:Transcriptional regulator n=2 Tax=Bacillus cereus group TaxID=86661 RepID=A0A1C4C9Q1_BACCE|nr:MULTISPECIES: MltR family transcriptional regulator [Bacillus cereus group]OKA34390.1 transcriptional regulator [Bacillus cereus]OKA38159.1 transcriptional regulator [Bacillus cereus]SCC15877.1 Mannitol operon repressor [Bacillus mobilis]
MKNNYIERTNKANEYLIALEEFEKELENSSDRGLVLVCGSIIDQLLSDLLKIVLIESDSVEKDLFKGNSVLATFDAKIKMSFYLGLISKKEKLNIIYLQRIRNRFAHQFVNISFENNEIINVCNNFEIPKNCYLPQKIPTSKKSNGEWPRIDLNPIKRDTPAKDKFIFTFRYLYNALVNRMLLESFKKGEEYTNVFTAEDIVLGQIKIMEKSLVEADENIKDLKVTIPDFNEKITLFQNKLEDFKRRQREKPLQENEARIKSFEIDLEKLAKTSEVSMEKREKLIIEYEEYHELVDSTLKDFREIYEVIKNSIKK